MSADEVMDAYPEPEEAMEEDEPKGRDDARMLAEEICHRCGATGGVDYWEGRLRAFLEDSESGLREDLLTAVSFLQRRKLNGTLTSKEARFLERQRNTQGGGP